MSKVSGILRSVLITSVAVSIAGCSGMLSGDPFKEEATETDGTSLGYSLSRKIVSGFGGVSEGSKKKINYKQRAPLAVPPAMVLKQPEDGKDVTSEMTNWPKEQDVAKDYLAERNEAKTYREKNRDDWENPNVPGREMSRFRVEGGGQKVDPDENSQRDAAPQFSNEEAEQFSEDMTKLRTAQADGTAKRQFLVEPPAIYRTAAGNAPLPSKVKVETKTKADDWENPTGY